MTREMAITKATTGTKHTTVWGAAPRPGRGHAPLHPKSFGMVRTNRRGLARRPAGVKPVVPDVISKKGASTHD